MLEYITYSRAWTISLSFLLSWFLWHGIRGQRDKKSRVRISITLPIQLEVRVYKISWSLNHHLHILVEASGYVIYFNKLINDLIENADFLTSYIEPYWCCTSWVWNIFYQDLSAQKAIRSFNRRLKTICTLSAKFIEVDNWVIG